MDASHQSCGAAAALCLVCRGGFEAVLTEEMAARAAAGSRPFRADAVAVESGFVRVVQPAAAVPADLVFARQRMEGAVLLSPGTLKPMARELLVRVLPPVSAATCAWTLHAFASNPDSEGDLSRRAASLEEVFLAACRERFPGVGRRYVPPREAPGHGDALVMQACVTPGGAWACVMPLRRLADPFPGGAHRMPFDALSPSRSYLKIEEALDLLGEAPRPGQSVVDLGAAPGGWTYAFAKRGCHVTAVDNGPLKLRATGRLGGTVRHLRQDGTLYEPPPASRPVDWLVSDMLMPAGRNLGMLRKWMDNRWMRRFVFNIKLPQEHAYAALQPVEKYLAGVPGLAFRMRQLYHDRREVTVFGRCAG